VKKAYFPAPTGLPLTNPTIVSAGSEFTVLVTTVGTTGAASSFLHDANNNTAKEIAIKNPDFLIVLFFY